MRFRVKQARPSWGQGLARHAAQSAYPGLWKGLVGAWMPELGVTGRRLVDVSGRGNHGTLTDMDPATDWVVGPGGYALSYNGTTNYVDVGDSPLFDFVTTQNDMSLLAWVFPSASLENQRVIHRTETASPADVWQVTFHHSSYVNKLTWSLRESDSQTSATSDSALTLNQWYCVVGTMQWPGPTMTLWIDGVQQSGTAGPALGSGDDNSFYFAKRRTTGNWFQGRLGLVSVWDRLLVPSEIQELYVKPFASFRLRSRTVVKAPVAGVNAPTGHLYGPLVGPLGGAI